MINYINIWEYLYNYKIVYFFLFFFKTSSTVMKLKSIDYDNGLQLIPTDLPGLCFALSKVKGQKNNPGMSGPSCA